MNKTELFIELEGTWRKLDLSDNVTFPIVYNIADVADISKRQSSFTKTLALPHTNNNSDVLGYIFDISIESTFNLNKKARAYVLNDTLQVFEGYFQLVEIKSDNNRKYEYQCVIFGDNDTLFKSMGDLFLTDLDFSSLNHNVSYTNMENSWNTDWTNGYYYPMIDFNNPEYDNTSGFRKSFRVVNFKPAVYAKYIFDKIISNSGFFYRSTFLESSYFTNLIIPFANKNSGQDPQWVRDNSLIIGLTSSFPITFTSSTGIAANTFALTEQRVALSNTSFPDYTDPSNRWDTATFSYKEDSVLDNPRNQSFSIDLDFTYKNYVSGTYAIPGVSNTTIESFRSYCYTTLKVYRSINPITNVAGNYTVQLDGRTPTTSQYINNFGADEDKWTYVLTGRETNVKDAILGSASLISQDTDPVTGFNRYFTVLDTVTFDGSTPERKPLQADEYLWVEIGLSFFNTLVQDTIGTIITQNALGNYPVVVNYPNTRIYNSIQPNILENQIIDFNSIVPEKVKQKDFFSSIVKMFNLYIDVDKDNPRELIIEPREDYYGLGDTLDWSDKLDISKEITQKLIAESNDKNILLTYKGDEDKWNKDYTDISSQVYGQYEYITENDFTKNTKKIELIFSPTPLLAIPGRADIVISRIDSNDAASEANKFYGKNIRILRRGDSNITVGTASPIRYKGLTTPNGGIYSTYSYAYAGHFDDPFTPSVDINFGQTPFLYYDGSTSTNNNLHFRYYRRSFEELMSNNSRIVTAHFYLTPQDINQLRLYDSIFVQNLASGTGNIFKINKIEYDPNLKGTTKVELLKALEIELNVTASAPPGIRLHQSSNTIKRQGVSPGSLSLGSDNSFTGDNGVIVGDQNFINSASGNTYIFGDRNNVVNSNSTSIIAGEDNNLYGVNDSSILSGRNNTINLGASSSVIIGGNSNQIAPYLSNVVLLGGNGAVGRQSNSVKMGGAIVSATNFISAGRDEVLNEFPDDKIVNYISAGRDKIRGLGSYSPEQIVNGGRDFII